MVQAKEGGKLPSQIIKDQINYYEEKNGNVAGSELNLLKTVIKLKSFIMEFSRVVKTFKVIFFCQAYIGNVGMVNIVVCFQLKSEYFF